MLIRKSSSTFPRKDDKTSSALDEVGFFFGIPGLGERRPSLEMNV